MITNEHYYTALNIMDRIEEIRINKNIQRTQFGDDLGFTKAYYYAFYNSCRIIKTSSLINFAKILNVSVEYLLTGKNLTQYKDFKLDFNKIINCKAQKLPNSLKVIKCKLKKGVTKDINIKTLFEFEYYIKIPAIKLIGGE